MNENAIRHIKEYNEILYAVEILEYHNSNWLSGSNQSRSIGKQELHKEIIKELDKITT
jgi:hypothetical protein